MSIVSKLIFRFNAIPIPEVFFFKHHTDYKIHAKIQKNRNNQDKLEEKNITAQFNLLDSRTCY